MAVLRLPERLAVAALTACLLGCPVADPTRVTNTGAGEGLTGTLGCDLNPSYLSLSAAAKDAIRSIDDPRWVTADDSTALEFLRSGDLVVGFTVDEKAYAVPVNILRYHEIANVTIAGADGPVDLAVTHCPLTGTSLVFDRFPVGGAELGVSGLLYQSNLVLYDRNTSESLWTQMWAEARCGPALGTVLDLYSFIEMRWDGWVGLYPETKVLARPRGSAGSYDVNPYAGYDAPYAEYTFPMPPLDTRLPPKEPVFGIGSSTGRSWIFPLADLGGFGQMAALTRSFPGVESEAVVFWDRDRRAVSAYGRRLDGNLLTFGGASDGIFDQETGSRWTVDGLAVEGPLAGHRLDRVGLAYVGYWGAWAAFFPLAEIWGARGHPSPGDPTMASGQHAPI